VFIRSLFFAQNDTTTHRFNPLKKEIVKTKPENRQFGMTVMNYVRPQLEFTEGELCGFM